MIALGVGIAKRGLKVKLTGWCPNILPTRNFCFLPMSLSSHLGKRKMLPMLGDSCSVAGGGTFLRSCARKLRHIKFIKFQQLWCFRKWDLKKGLTVWQDGIHRRFCPTFSMNMFASYWHFLFLDVSLFHPSKSIKGVWNAGCARLPKTAQGRSARTAKWKQLYRNKKQPAYIYEYVYILYLIYPNLLGALLLMPINNPNCTPKRGRDTWTPNPRMSSQSK